MGRKRTKTKLATPAPTATSVIVTPALAPNWKLLSKKLGKNNSSSGLVSKKTSPQTKSLVSHNAAHTKNLIAAVNGVHSHAAAVPEAAAGNTPPVTPVAPVADVSTAVAMVTDIVSDADVCMASRDLKILSAIIGEDGYVCRPPSPQGRDDDDDDETSKTVATSHFRVTAATAHSIAAELNDNSIPTTNDIHGNVTASDSAKKSTKLALLSEAAKAILAKSPVETVDLSRDLTGSQSNTTKIGKYVAIDCEMVGVGPNGAQSVLARVSIVNYHGHVLIDAFVKAQERVTDYRTFVSGITPELLRRHGRPFREVQKEVADILKDRIIIGHALQNDFDALLLSHPKWLVRDTSKYKLLRHATTGKAQSLRKLTASILGVTIQSGEHSSVEDARATMLIYRRFSKSWETELRRFNHKHVK